MCRAILLRELTIGYSGLPLCQCGSLLGLEPRSYRSRRCRRGSRTCRRRLPLTQILSSLLLLLLLL